MKRIQSIILMTLTLSLGLCPAVSAWWEADGVPVCTITYDQDAHAVISDGRGGVIVVWYDDRESVDDVYIQRLDAGGNPMWGANGLPVCRSVYIQLNPDLTTDGAGGAIVVWEDMRPAISTDIYAQRVDADGDTLWTLNGVPVCTYGGNQKYPVIVSDLSGGAIVAWEDDRNGNLDVYAQHIDADGNTLWLADGVVICNATGNQQTIDMVSNGAGGAIMAWQDNRGGSGWDILAAMISSLGGKAWTSNGEILCYAANNQTNVAVAPDGTGGAIAAWYDMRVDGLTGDIYAQRVDYNGTVRWTTHGKPLCTQSGNQWYPDIASDGAGGAIVAWGDARTMSHWDIYAQRIDSNANTRWTTDGIAISTPSGHQEYPQIVPDESNGAIIAWEDARNGLKDIYAQAVDSAGTTSWLTDGRSVCTAPGNQVTAILARDGNGGTVFAWTDSRTGQKDVYALGVDADADWEYVPAIHSIEDVPSDQGGQVNLAWDATRFDPNPDVDITEYTIWRAMTSAQAAQMFAAGAKILDRPFTSQVLAGDRPSVRVHRLGGTDYYWEYIDYQTAFHFDAYSKTITSLYDSTSAGPAMQYYQVVAHTPDPYEWFASEPDSGYSVDNLAPAAPQGLAGDQTAAEEMELTWLPNAETDLSHYYVYRGADAGFVPGAGNRIGTTSDEDLVDGDWTWDSGYWYKVTAVDIHDNESLVATLGPEGVTAVDDGVPGQTYLAQNHPNPFNPTTTISFGLSAPGAVKLRIYDATGRLVRTLVDRRYDAGQHGATWNGRDDGGQMVTTGIYFYRLNAGDETFTRKMLLLK